MGRELPNSADDFCDRTALGGPGYAPRAAVAHVITAGLPFLPQDTRWEPARAAAKPAATRAARRGRAFLKLTAAAALRGVMRAAEAAARRPGPSPGPAASGTGVHFGIRGGGPGGMASLSRRGGAAARAAGRSQAREGSPCRGRSMAPQIAQSALCVAAGEGVDHTVGLECCILVASAAPPCRARTGGRCLAS